MGYRYVVDASVAEIVLKLSTRRREMFIGYFRELANDPYQQGEESFLDSSGRKIQKKQLGRWF